MKFDKRVHTAILCRFRTLTGTISKLSIAKTLHCPDSIRTAYSARMESLQVHERNTHSHIKHARWCFAVVRSTVIIVKIIVMSPSSGLCDMVLNNYHLVATTDPAISQEVSSDSWCFLGCGMNHYHSMNLFRNFTLPLPLLLVHVCHSESNNLVRVLLLVYCGETYCICQLNTWIMMVHYFVAWLVQN